MGKAEQYRHYAAECVRLATQLQDTKEKQTLLAMAEVWRSLADRAKDVESADDESN